MKIMMSIWSSDGESIDWEQEFKNYENLETDGEEAEEPDVILYN